MSKTQITSPVVGTLALLHVENGATVAAGETIGEVESMKMYLGLVTSVGGVVRWRYNLGEIVGEGDVIAEVE